MGLWYPAAEPQQDGLSANRMLSLDEQEFHCQRAPAVYVPVAGGCGRMGDTTLTLRTMDVGELREVLTTAWRLAQPKPKREGQLKVAQGDPSLELVAWTQDG